MNFKVFHMSEKGASHIRDGKVCQDSSSSFSDEWGKVAVVSDGHGGCDYVRSQIGATMACEVAVDTIRFMLKNINSVDFLGNPEQALTQLEASIIHAWNENVRKHYEANPFTEEELNGVSEAAREAYGNGEKIERAYGATLIATAVTRDYWFGIQIGDGKCVAVDDEGHFTQPVPWDERCFLNQTTSICGSQALHDFRHFYSRDIPAAIFVASDGVDQSFKNEEDMYGFYATILYAFSISEYTDAVDELKAYLPTMSKTGSLDDISVAACMNMHTLMSVVDKINDAKREKKKTEEIIERKTQKKVRERESVHYPKFCCMCGAKLIPGKLYCQCGARILWNAINPSTNALDWAKRRFLSKIEDYLG